MAKEVQQIAALLQGFDTNLQGFDTNTHAREMGLSRGVSVLPDYSRQAWARLLDGSYTGGLIEASVTAALQRELIRMQERDAQRRARLRVICGAKTTRKGTPCKNMSETGQKRCKFHGGRSTGPRTAEGKERIAEAQRRRWARWRGMSKPRQTTAPMASKENSEISSGNHPSLSEKANADQYQENSVNPNHCAQTPYSSLCRECQCAPNDYPRDNKKY